MVLSKIFAFDFLWRWNNFIKFDIIKIPYNSLMTLSDNSFSDFVLTAWKLNSDHFESWPFYLSPSSNEGEIIIFPDPLPQKWSKKYFPVGHHQYYKKKKKKKKNSKRTISIDLNSHQLFELFFEDKVVTYLCEQSKIYAASKGNFVFRVIPDEFRGF